MCEDRQAQVQTDDLLKHMHDTAGRYYLHFSTVRTMATSLVAPIGILASITLVVNCRTHHDGRFALYLLGFIVLTTLALNWVFSVWSAACRRIEQLYETMLSGTEAFRLGDHGFRTIFRTKIYFMDGCDVFTIFVIVFGAAYIVLYYFLLPPVCRP